jgi:hypothetical protein
MTLGTIRTALCGYGRERDTDEFGQHAAYVVYLVADHPCMSTVASTLRW